MAIRVVPLPEFDLTVTIYSGRVTRDELVQHCGAFDVDTAGSACWIGYYDPEVDLSDIDVAAIAVMARTTRLIGTKLKALRGPHRQAWAMVSNSGANKPMLDLWISYIRGDPEHPAKPALFSNLEDACDWLELPNAARRAIAQAIAAEGPAAAERPLRAEAVRASPSRDFAGRR